LVSCQPGRTVWPVAWILSPAFDAGRYKERNTVERCFSKPKQFRAIATRYDKRGFMYQGTVDVASIRIWLRDPVP
jgi:transposase